MSPRHTGHALVGTMCFLVLMMLLWLAAFSHLGSYMRVEKATQTRQARDGGCTREMAWGLTLLETGLPPTNPYSCRVVPGNGQTYVIKFTSYVALRYSVSVRPATSGDNSLPNAPGKF